MVGLTGLISLVLLTINFGRIDPIPDATKITEVLYCQAEGCVPEVPTELPFFADTMPSTAIMSMKFRASLDGLNAKDQVYAVYLPKLSDHVAVTFNGTLLRDLYLERRQWAEPQLIDVPSVLVRSDENVLDITVAGRPAEGIELYPVFFGPRATLVSAYETRFAVGVGFARLNLAFLLVLGVVYALVWSSRPGDHRYLWLGLSCVSGCVILLQFGFGVLWGGYKIWTGVVHLAVGSYVLFVMKFVRLQMRLEELRIERTLQLVLVLGAASLLLIGPGQLLNWALILNLFTAAAAIAVCTVLWLHRKKIEHADFLVIFCCMTLATGLGAHEMILVHFPGPDQSFHLFHFVPVCMSLVCLWVIVTQLVRTLRRYEVLTETLSDTIALKTHQLEKSFARLAKVERREAVDRERNRIMLDLHDGIGGQLVSTLAYVESTGNKDQTLRDALENALRDLALVLDSLDSHDSLTTLLGMLRTRLEPLLADNDLKFDWQIRDEPIIPQAGPSTNLHLARIVQEAITNVIKHARASTITVYADDQSIVISDDGVGMQDGKTGDREGHGLVGMKQRADSMGANFEVRSAPSGTSIHLSFPRAAVAKETADSALA